MALAMESLSRNRRLRLRATGASMLPALRPGDELDFRACALADLPAGAIALCRRDDRLVIHRVLGTTGNALLTQGDAMAQPDPPVAAADVLGRLERVHRLRQVYPEPTATPLHRLAGWLFGRSNLLTRLFLRWHLIRSIRTAT